MPAAGPVVRRGRVVGDLRVVPERRVEAFRVVDPAVAGLVVVAFAAAGLAVAVVVAAVVAVADLALVAAFAVAGLRVAAFAVAGLRVLAFAVAGLPAAAVAADEAVVAAAALVVARFAAVRRALVDPALRRVVAGVAVAGADALELAAAGFAVVFRLVAGRRLTLLRAEAAVVAARLARTRGADVMGDTACAAMTAADPTSIAASPTTSAALPAAARARPPILTTRPATSAAAAAACCRRFATCLRPFDASALASCPRRLVSVARASSSCLPSFLSSRAALRGTGADAFWAAATTSRAAPTTSAGRLERFALGAPFVDFAIVGISLFTFAPDVRAHGTVPLGG